MIETYFIKKYISENQRSVARNLELHELESLAIIWMTPRNRQLPVQIFLLMELPAKH